LRGWRSEVFGEDALRLCDGRVALTADGTDVKIIYLD
jgi:ribonuclease D